MYKCTYENNDYSTNSLGVRESLLLNDK